MSRILSAHIPLSGQFANSIVKMMLSFSNRAHRIADAHDARERFANLQHWQLEDIGLTDADRDYLISRS